MWCLLWEIWVSRREFRFSGRPLVSFLCEFFIQPWEKRWAQRNHTWIIVKYPTLVELEMVITIVWLHFIIIVIIIIITHVHFYTEGNSDSGKNEFVLQSLVVPDLRHIGIKTSLSYSEKKEDLNTYDTKKGLRDAISQAYRR